jgi:cell wall integrity and stress response component
MLLSRLSLFIVDLFANFQFDSIGIGTNSSQTTPDTTSTTPTTTPQKTDKSSSSSSTWTPTPVVSLETITGQVRTVTVTPTTPPDSLNITGAATKKSSSSGLSTGGAVGLTVGLVALVALICSIIYFCIRKRRKEKARAAADDINSRRGSSAGLGGHIPSRTMSENSRYVLGTDGRQVVETWEPETRDAPGSRRSRLMPVDPRLDPFAPVYQRGENKSRESVNTIRDDHDYSRRVHQQGPILRATNPDE